MPKCGYLLMGILFMGFVFFMMVLDTPAKPRNRKKPIDPADMDLSVPPGEDFYRYANGAWLKHNPLPADYSRWGSFEILGEKNMNDLRTILEEAARDRKAPPGSHIRKIGDFYASGMNARRIEAEGIKPLEEEFRRIDLIKSRQDMQEVMARLHTLGINPAFNFFAEQDKKNSEMTIAWLYQGGLGLPDRDYYLEKTPRAREIREEYVGHVARMFTLLGETGDRAELSAKRVMKIETRLAGKSMTRLQRRDPRATYNKMSLAELDKAAGLFDFVLYFRNIGLEAPGDINVAQPEFFREVGRMIAWVSLEDWRTYLRWHLIKDTAKYLSSPFVNENFRFYGAFLQGAKKLQPRWKRVLSAVNSGLGEAVGRIYVQKYFPPAAKARALELVMNLEAAFGKRIKELGWMNEQTKARALEKLAAFRVKIGYPDKWIDDSGLEIVRDTYVLNVLRAVAFEFRRELKKIGSPVDRDEWQMPPQTVNAYYHPFLNEIVFPAAILQPPFFYFEADDAVNYGAIGAVIGHEMTHGFDDQGRQFDKKGNMNDWWTEADEKKFKKRADILVRQFDLYEAGDQTDQAHVDGKLTLGENIADLGGLSIAFDALKGSPAKNPPPARIDGFTPRQRFFLSWAQVWRGNIREKALLLRLKTDVHAPGRFRTIGPLANLTVFHEAFGVKPGDAMFRPPKERVEIW